MVKISFARRIERPRPAVFELFSDIDEMPRRVSGIASVARLTSGPVGVGTRFRETREVFGKKATEEMEFTRFEPDEAYTVECESHGTHYRSVFRFEPVGDQTEVQVSFEARPVSLGAKLLAPLGWLMAKSTKKMIARDVDDLKKFAEQTN